MPPPKRNYALELERLVGALPPGTRPRLLLHVCCAPCLSGCLAFLAAHFKVTLFPYNPNISPEKEYRKRLAEIQRLITEMPLESPVDIMPAPYVHADFLEAARGLEAAPEGGSRCLACFRLRLGETARAARDNGFDYFTTTLSISPLKDAQALNQIGQELAEKYGAACLPADFKKRDGFKRSVEMSRRYGLYRQNYCGCAFSRREVPV